MPVKAEELKVGQVVRYRRLGSPETGEYLKIVSIDANRIWIAGKRATEDGNGDQRYRWPEAIRADSVLEIVHQPEEVSEHA